MCEHKSSTSRAQTEHSRSHWTAISMHKTVIRSPILFINHYFLSLKLLEKSKTLANRRKMTFLATAQMFNGNAVALHKSIGNSGNSCIWRQILNFNLFLYEYLKCKRSWDAMTPLMTYTVYGYMDCLRASLTTVQCSVAPLSDASPALNRTTLYSPVLKSRQLLYKFGKTHSNIVI